MKQYNLSYAENLKLITYKESKEAYNYFSSSRELAIKELDMDYATKCTELNDKNLVHGEYLMKKQALDLAYDLQKHCLSEIYKSARILHTVDDTVSEVEQQALKSPF